MKLSPTTVGFPSKQDFDPLHSASCCGFQAGLQGSVFPSELGDLEGLSNLSDSVIGLHETEVKQ